MSDLPHDAQRMARLRILQTTDLHMCLIPFDYLRNHSGGDYSLARLAPEITARKSDEMTTLLFDTGDIFQGNPLADYAMHNRRKDEINPMAAAMNGLAYDAVTPGNHDFDYGITQLNNVLDDLSCPVVLSNVSAPQLQQTQGTLLLDRDVLCDDGMRRRIKIGVLGLLTTATSFATGDDATVHDIVQTAKDHTPALRRAGADIIVALCHCGLTDVSETTEFAGPLERDGQGDGNVAAELARRADVDVILAGHVHGIFPNNDTPSGVGIDPILGTLSGKPALMAGAYGSHLGQIDLTLTRGPDRWQVTGHTARVIATTDMPQRPDAAAAAITKATADMHQRTRAHIATPLGRIQTRIHSYFAQVAADPSLRLLADAKIAHAQHALATTTAAGLPLVAAVSPFRVGGQAGPYHFVDITPGDLTLRDVGALYPFENKLGIAVVTGAKIKALLAQSSTLFHQLEPGVQNQALIRKEIPAYQAQTLFGMTYDIDLTQPAGPARIRSLCYQGIPVQDTDPIAMTASTYALSSRKNDPARTQEDIVYLSDEPLHDLIGTYIRNAGDVTLSSDRVWNFTPVPNATAIFQSSPAARAFVDTVPDRQITAGALRDDGFRDYILSL